MVCPTLRFFSATAGTPGRSQAARKQVRRRSFGGRSSQGGRGALVFAVSDKFQPKLAANSHSSALESVQCNTRVGRIEQTVECSTAGLHADCHGRLGEAVLLHGDRKKTRLNSSHLGLSYAV